MERKERKVLLRACEELLVPSSSPRWNDIGEAIKRLRTLFDDYDALEERLEGMTLSSEAAHTYAVELEAKLAEAESAVEAERDRWVKAFSGSLAQDWVHEKLSDPDFCKGFVEEQQRLAVEEERERCVRIARTEVLVREKARRMGAGTTPEDFARKVEAAMRQGE